MFYVWQKGCDNGPFLPCTYFMYFTHLIDFFSIFVIRYGKKEESSKSG
ncbi:hypothetical protein GGD38_006672 [Chitinophagaceae bacterium OAS944]|nr:hypothetical protein [Chitinophagaceae bacterium OAS944]